MKVMLFVDMVHLRVLYDSSNKNSYFTVQIELIGLSE